MLSHNHSQFLFCHGNILSLCKNTIYCVKSVIAQNPVDLTRRRVKFTAFLGHGCLFLLMPLAQTWLAMQWYLK
jgi:hypothetical protein